MRALEDEDFEKGADEGDQTYGKLGIAESHLDRGGSANQVAEINAA